VLFVDSLHGWINASSSFAVFRTTNGGENWQPFSSPFFSAIEFIDTLRGWGASGRSFYRTMDGGTSWDSLFTVPSPGDNFYAADLSFPDSLYGWAFGWGVYQGNITEAIYHTTNGGVTWFRESIGLTDDLGTLSDGVMLDRTHGWTAAADGRVLAYRPTTWVPERLPEVPTTFSLRQNYPNPFNPATTIEYQLKERSTIQLAVYDLNGRLTQLLVEGMQEAGTYRIRWNASGIASGIYWYRLKAGSYEEGRQMILLR
jgi:hypothetical protein